jgi:hypothetical protein
MENREAKQAVMAIPPVIQQQPEDEPMIEDFPTALSCPHCTFDNELTATVCAVCGGALS